MCINLCPTVTLRRILTASASMLIMGALPAWADGQTTSSSSTSSANSSSTTELEEIRVTATRRETTVQTTPIAITALSHADLQDSNITDLTKLPMQVPSLFVGGNDNFGSNSVSIRGIGSLALGLGAEEAVGIYIDGVYQGKPYGNIFNFVDIDRIEVLEGPQGTLYGRNATGGAINIVTIQPGNEFTGQANATFTNYGGVNLSAYAIVPLVPNVLSLKVAVGEEHRDGWAYDPTQNSHPYNLHNQYGSFALRWTPDSETDVTLAGRVGNTYTGDMFKDANSTLPIDIFPDYYPSYTQNRFADASLTINRDLGFANLTSISGFQDASAIVSSDSGLLPQESIDYNAWAYTTQMTQELRLVSKDTGPFSWLAGAQYYHENSKIYLPFQVVIADTGVLFDAKLRTNSYSGYAEGTYKVTDKLSITAGGRYSVDAKRWEGCGNTDIPLGQGISPADCAGPETVLQSRRWDALTPHAVLDYQATDRILLYTSATKGFRSGGWNFAIATDAQSPFNPEYVWSYEAGIKSDWFDRTVRLNLTGFHANYSQLQVRANVGEFLSVYNAGSAKINGVELQSGFRPLEGLDLGFNAAWLDAQYTQYAYTTDGVVTDFSGQTLSRAPKWDLTGNVQYRFNAGDWVTVTPRAEYHFVSQVFYLQPDIQPEGADAIHIVNVSVKFQPTHQPWNVSLFCDNATNVQFRTHTFDNPLGVVAASYSDPRIYGAKLQYNW
jgi:iron complex outermembrane receptor protein